MPEKLLWGGGAIERPAIFQGAPPPLPLEQTVRPLIYHKIMLIIVTTHEG